MIGGQVETRACVAEFPFFVNRNQRYNLCTLTKCDCAAGIFISTNAILLSPYYRLIINSQYYPILFSVNA